MKPLNQYNSIIFDCDGVLINSNQIKTKAFWEVANRHGEKVANDFVAYHKSNGGISRQEKFRHLYSNILGEEVCFNTVTKDIDDYAKIVSGELIGAPVAQGLDKLKSITLNSIWSVVSGGDEEELRILFEANGLIKFFGAQIFGSPRSKIEIIEEGLGESLFCSPTLFIGDSEYDFEVASFFNFDFVFLSAWSEWTPCEALSFPCYDDIESFMRANLT